MRQVTHALLTRPPLSHKQLQSEEICRKCFVRLACVKHAASVHPEPGSNSHKKMFSAKTFASSLKRLAKIRKLHRSLNPVSFELTSFNSFLILCLRIHSIAWMMFTKDVYLIPMNYCTHLEILKRIFKVVFLFSYQSSSLSSSVFICVWEAFVSLISRGDLIIIAPTRYYVNNFFQFFWIFSNFFKNPLKYGISKQYKYWFWQLLDDICL